MGYSFYDWCIDNNRTDILDRWNNEMTGFLPEEVGYGSGRICYLNCLVNSTHKPERFRIGHITDSGIKAECKQCNSFYQWCLDNKRYDLIDAWDDKLNINDMRFVSRGSCEKYYFKVLDVAPSVLYRISDITCKGHSPIDKFYNSFGYYLINHFGEDAIQRYWSDKNQLTPWDYDAGSGKKVWFKCQEKNYHEDYIATIDRFTRGNRCPWCAGKMVHPLDSFAQYNINRLGMDFLEKYWCDNNTVDPWKIRPFTTDVIYIQCQTKSYHKYDTTAANFSSGILCPFCNKKRVHPLDSFGAQFPEVRTVWSDKNIKTPFDYRVTSHVKVWFKCGNGKHEDYQRRIADYSYKGFTECPECVREHEDSFFQLKVKTLLECMPYVILHEYSCTIVPVNPNTKCKMPFDNEVCDVNGMNLIIEVHGIQHYELCGWHITQAKKSGRTPEEEFEYQKWKDKFKRDYALAHGYKYLEVPYYTILDDTYIKLITNTINEINNTTSQETLETAGDVWQHIS